MAEKILPFHATPLQLRAAGIVVAVHVIPLVEYAAVVVLYVSTTEVVPFDALFVLKPTGDSGMVLLAQVTESVERYA
jgi:hypothetical protein